MSLMMLMTACWGVLENKEFQVVGLVMVNTGDCRNAVGGDSVSRVVYWTDRSIVYDDGGIGYWLLVLDTD